jgi:hypothetical protein
MFFSYPETGESPGENRPGRFSRFFFAARKEPHGAVSRFFLYRIEPSQTVFQTVLPFFLYHSEPSQTVSGKFPG